LAIAVPDVSGDYQPGRDFQWMKYWTAKVDLDLQTTDTSNVTPTAQYFVPMLPAALPGIGSFAQNFTLNFGGNLKHDAFRDDKVSFTLSINELSQMRHLEVCDLSRGAGLLGNLGLSEWIVSALAPVEYRQLTIGYHQPPTGKPVEIAPPGIATAKKQKLLK